MTINKKIFKSKEKIQLNKKKIKFLKTHTKNFLKNAIILIIKKNASMKIHNQMKKINKIKNNL